jgi:8-oxo-dGTP pyrophosphatase MutT (NUDIX family)
LSPVRPDLVACWLFRLDAEGKPEILLIRRAPGRIYPGLWQCVTGKLEAGERIVAGALREVIEETGFGGADLEAVFETDLVNWFHEETIDVIWCEAVFAARVSPAATVELSDEHDDLRWLTPEAARELVTWPAYVRAIDMVVWLVDNPTRAGAFRLLLDSVS